jgi:ubiquitin carboxyl-terminal hydrolase 25/28
LPNISPLNREFHYNRSKRDFLEDVITELHQRVLNRRTNETRNLIGGKTYVIEALPALKDIQRTLGYDKYERNRVVINLDEHEHEHPHYAGLGAVGDFADELIIFAYERQHECDPKNRPYYLECLQGIAKGRGSADLHEKSVMAVSLGEHTLTEVEAAYRFFAIEPDTREGDDHIIGLYESRIDSAPRQKDEARECLLIIGQARNSQKIQTVAMENPMSFEEALEFLGVVQNTPSDSIEAMAVAMVCYYIFITIHMM